MRKFWESIKLYFTSFPRLLLYSIYTLVLSLGIITIGGALIALCTCTREICEHGVPKTPDYFKIFKKKFLCGIFYSFTVILCIVFLSLKVEKFDLMFLGYVAIIALIFITLYYPSAAKIENNTGKILRLSLFYCLEHIWQSIIIISTMYILLFAIALISEFLLIIFFATIYFIMSRIIISNNEKQMGNSPEGE